MRRGLLTAATAPPITVGYSGTFGTSAWSARLAIDLSGPASGAGTIVSVDTNAIATAAEVRILTGSVSGSNFTVTAVSSAFTAASGANNYAVSLPIAADDFIAYWCATAAQGLNYDSGVGGSIGYGTNPTTTPTVSQVIAFSTFSGRFSIRGTS